MCTRKEEDYTNYIDALNAATTEIRQSKRSYEQQLACNIKIIVLLSVHRKLHFYSSMTMSMSMCMHH